MGKSAQSNVATRKYVGGGGGGGQVQWSERFGGAASDAGTAVTVDDFGNILIAGSVTGSVDFGGCLASGTGNSGFIAKYSSSRVCNWAKSFNGSQGTSNIMGIATDSSGNVYVTGSFVNQVDFGGGFRTSFASPRLSNYDVFIASFTANGVFRWDKTLAQATGTAASPSPRRAMGTSSVSPGMRISPATATTLGTGLPYSDQLGVGYLPGTVLRSDWRLPMGQVHRRDWPGRRLGRGRRVQR